eukprot:3864561-Rhodomonas_salina.1
MHQMRPNASVGAGREEQAMMARGKRCGRRTARALEPVVPGALVRVQGVHELLAVSEVRPLDLRPTHPSASRHPASLPFAFRSRRLWPVTPEPRPLNPTPSTLRPAP